MYVQNSFNKIDVVQQLGNTGAELTFNQNVFGSGFPCDLQKIVRVSPSFT
jgi:hypothetical protein